VDVKALAKQGQRFLRSKSPEILAGVGISGVVGTAYLAHQVGFRSAYVVNKQEVWQDKVRHNWKRYIPVAALGTATIVCIVGGTKISSRRTAAMAAAYSISEHAFLEYKEQVKEKFGTLRFYFDGGDEEIRGMVALAEHMTKHTCEECGKPGRLITTRGWVRVACPKHAKVKTL